MTRAVSLAPDQARRLAAILVGHDYVGCLQRLLGDPPAASIRHLGRHYSQNRDSLPIPPGPGGQLIDLFFLGRRCLIAESKALLGDDLREAMVEGGLLEQSDGFVSSTRYMLIPFCGRPYFVSRLRHPESAPNSVAVYVGRDTDELTMASRDLKPSRVLDLGCGGGLIGITIAAERPAATVIGTDLCEEAVCIARINAQLAGIRYEARHGDTYAPVSGDRFDLIVADPPAIALPPELASPIYGSGGEEGDSLLRQIVRGAPAHLAAGGRLLAISELQCSSEEPSFVAWARTWLRANVALALRLRWVGSRRLPPSYHSDLGANLGFLPGTGFADPDSSARSMAAFSKRKRVFFGHWVHLSLDPCRKGARLTQSFDYIRARPESRPRRAGSFNAVRDRLARHYPDSPDGFDAHLSRFLRLCSGRASLATIAAEAQPQLRTDLGLGPSEGLPYLVQLATALGQIGVLDFPEWASEKRRCPA